jgi:hypothetical protein
MNVEEIFQQVMNENCKDPLHRFAELVRQDERERIWVGLTEKEIFEADNAGQGLIEFARAIETKLKGRNT